MSEVTPETRASLAPLGVLRAGVNYGNFILATRDPATGESHGVAIDLARELAGRLGVRLEIVPYDSVAVMVDAAPTNAWDIAFLGSDPARERLIDFTAAYMAQLQANQQEGSAGGGEQVPTETADEA